MKEEGVFIGHYECLDCGSDDNLALYEKENKIDGFCNTPDCGYKSQDKLSTFPFAEELGIKKGGDKKVSRKRKAVRGKKVKEPITKEQIAEVMESSGYKGKGYRKLKDFYNKYFRVRTEFDEDSGEPARRLYPCTEGFVDCQPNLVGYKVRTLPKDFSKGPIGKVSKECDLFNQWNCKNTKYLLITGGEEDAIAAKQMLHEAKKDSWAEVDVVSSIIGEGSIADQCKNQYDFIDRYENIILNCDMDEAGDVAKNKLLDCLPAGKVKIMTISEKDASDMLQKGKEEEFVRAFYDARKPKISGISDGLEILDKIKAVCTEEKIPLPDFMRGVNKALGGGYSPSSFNIIAAQTSVGKTTVSYQTLEHFVKSGIKTGDISLEASAGQVGENLVSLHLGKRLVDVEDPEEKVALVEEHYADLKEFLYDEDGNSNLFILDDRSLLEDIDSIFKNIEKLIKVCGIRVLIIDVLSDLMDVMSIEEQADFMGRIKKLIARHTICIIGIMHCRKPSDKRDPHDISEFDIYGSSTAIKSAHSVILLSRDKLAEDEEERNTTRVKLTKNRGTGRTGRMNDIVYNHNTGRLTEKMNNGVNF